MLEGRGLNLSGRLREDPKTEIFTRECAIYEAARAVMRHLGEGSMFIKVEIADGVKHGPSKSDYFFRCTTIRNWSYMGNCIITPKDTAPFVQSVLVREILLGSHQNKSFRCDFDEMGEVAVTEITDQRA